MKHKLLFQRFFASLLLLAVSALSWAYDFEVDGIYYNIRGSNATVTYKDYNYNSYSGDVTIPSTVTYNDVVYNVTSIGSDAFYNSSGLTSITFPNSVTSIGNYAFENCSGLTSITIPNSVTSIGYTAFSACSGLTSIIVASDNPGYDSRNNCNAIIETATNTLVAGCKNTVIPESVTTIGSSAFSDCSGLTSVTIPNSVTSIGDYAFSSCYGLTSVTIGNSVTSIGSSAFNGCSGLTSIIVASDNPRYDSRNNCNAIIRTATNTLVAGCKNTVIPNNVTSIGSDAFSGCSGLISVTIPNSVTSIGNYAFENCFGLTSISIPNSVTSIGDYAFYGCTSLPVIDNIIYADTYLVVAVDKTLSTYNIKDGTRFIGSSAFFGCSGLTSITIPESVTSIDDFAFKSCSGLTSITIPESVTSIGQQAFYGCSGLTRAEFASIESLCNISFEDATANPLIGAHHLYIDGQEVTNVVIPNGVTSIGSYAFRNCSGLKSITIPNSVTSIGDGALSFCSNLTSVTLNSNAIASKTYTDYNSLSGIFGSRVKEYVIGDDVTRIGDFAFYNCENLSSITIPNSVTSIGGYAFYGCTSLPVIDNIRYADTYLVEAVDKSQSTYNIKNGTRFIGNGAFEWCYGFTSITIPNSVTSIGSRAFNGSSLTSVTIPNSMTSIGNGAFYGCYRLTSITIPNSVTSIGNGAFSFCSDLTSITIPESVTSIGNQAFSFCSNLTSVICKVQSSDIRTEDLVKPTEPTWTTKPEPGIDPEDIPVSDYRYPFNPAHNTELDPPTTENCEETTDVTVDNLYTEDEIKELWLNYYKKVYNTRNATVRSRNKCNTLIVNPYIIRSDGRGGYEAITFIQYRREWERYQDVWNEYYSDLEKYETYLNYETVPVPATGNSVFEEVDQENATLYVYDSVIDAYRVTEPWSKFGKILPIDPSAVDEIEASEEKADINANAPIYDLNGRRLTEKPKSGYYIQGGKKYRVN